jgi:hypothetical protein
MRRLARAGVDLLFSAIAALRDGHSLQNARLQVRVSLPAT